MERIQGNRSDSYTFVDPDTQYMYYGDHITRGGAGVSRYFHCVVTGCPGRVIWRLGEVIELTIAHNHEARGMDVDILHFKQTLRQRAENETITLRNIYIDVQMRHPNIALEIGGFAGSIKKMMERARKSGIPPIPRDLAEMHHSLRDGRYVNRFSVELGPAARQFYQGLLEVGDMEIEKIIYFVSPTIKDIARELDRPVELHMDATFAVVPVAAGGRQLFTVQLLYANSVFPIVYAIMERRTKISYDALLQVVRDNVLNNINVSSIVADYEVALRQSVRDIFPNARLTGCWFHYCRAVHLRGRQLRLTAQHNTYEVRQGVKMGMALALLHRNMFEQGRLEVHRWMLQTARPNEIEGVNSFAEYLDHQWGTINVSVHGLSVRTNNAVESFHKTFNQLVGRRHPNVWLFVSFLQKIEHSKACDLIRLRRGIQVPPEQRPRWRRLSRTIEAAQLRLDQDNDVGHFLRHMSHAVEGLHHQLDPAAPQAPLVVPPLAPAAPPAPPLLPVLLPAAFDEEAPAALDALPPAPPLAAAAPPAPLLVPVPPPVPVHLPEAEIQALDMPPAAAQEPPEDDNCLFCRIEAAKHAYLPCRHRAVCGDCANMMLERGMLQCLLCRGVARAIT